MGSHGIFTAAEVGTLAADHPDTEAVLVPDAAMHSLEIVDDLKATIGKPVLTANQVTMWSALELAGHEGVGPGQRLLTIR